MAKVMKDDLNMMITDKWKHEVEMLTNISILLRKIQCLNTHLIISIKILTISIRMIEISTKIQAMAK